MNAFEAGYRACVKGLEMDRARRDYEYVMANYAQKFVDKYTGLDRGLQGHYCTSKEDRERLIPVRAQELKDVADVLRYLLEKIK